MTNKSAGTIWMERKDKRVLPPAIKRAQRKQFAGWVRQKRKDAGLTLNEAAQKLGYQSASAIKRIETGYEPVPVKRIIDFAACYKIPMPELLEKLRALEPRTAEEFEFLERKFSAYFLHMYKDMESDGKTKAGKGGSLHMSNYQTLDNIEHPWHHKPFPNKFGMLENIFLFTEVYIIRHWNPPFSILSTARRLFAKIHNITILGNSLPFFVKPLLCLDSPLSIRA